MNAENTNGIQVHSSTLTEKFDQFKSEANLEAQEKMSLASGKEDAFDPELKQQITSVRDENLSESLQQFLPPPEVFTNVSSGKGETSNPESNSSDQTPKSTARGRGRPPGSIKSRNARKSVNRGKKLEAGVVDDEDEYIESDDDDDDDVYEDVSNNGDANQDTYIDDEELADDMLADETGFLAARRRRAKSEGRATKKPLKVSTNSFGMEERGVSQMPTQMMMSMQGQQIPIPGVSGQYIPQGQQPILPQQGHPMAGNFPRNMIMSGFPGGPIQATMPPGPGNAPQMAFQYNPQLGQYMWVPMMVGQPCPLPQQLPTSLPQQQLSNSSTTSSPNNIGVSGSGINSPSAGFVGENPSTPVHSGHTNIMQHQQPIYSLPAGSHSVPSYSSQPAPHPHSILAGGANNNPMSSAGYRPPMLPMQQMNPMQLHQMNLQQQQAAPFYPFMPGMMMHSGSSPSSSMVRVANANPQYPTPGYPPNRSSSSTMSTHVPGYAGPRGAGFPGAASSGPRPIMQAGPTRGPGVPHYGGSNPSLLPRSAMLTSMMNAAAIATKASGSGTPGSAGIGNYSLKGHPSTSVNKRSKRQQQRDAKRLRNRREAEGITSDEDDDEADFASGEHPGLVADEDDINPVDDDEVVGTKLAKHRSPRSDGFSGSLSSKFHDSYTKGDSQSPFQLSNENDSFALAAMHGIRSSNRPKRESLKRLDYAEMDASLEAAVEEAAIAQDLEASAPGSNLISNISKPKKVSNYDSSTPRSFSKKSSLKNAAEDAENLYASFHSEDSDDGGGPFSRKVVSFVEKILTAKGMTPSQGRRMNEHLLASGPAGSTDEHTYEGDLDSLRLLPKVKEDYKSPLSSSTEGNKLDVTEQIDENKPVLLYLIKRTGRSYLHLEWVTKALIRAERGGHIRLTRFTKRFERQQAERAAKLAASSATQSVLGHAQRRGGMAEQEDEEEEQLEEDVEEVLGDVGRLRTDFGKSSTDYLGEEIFDPAFTTIDRIIYHSDEYEEVEKLNDLSISPDYIKKEELPSVKSSNMIRSYFVKWCGLPLTECTWESKSDLLALKHGADRIAAYESNLVPKIEKVRAAQLLESHVTAIKANIPSASMGTAAGDLSMPVLGLMVGATMQRPVYAPLTDADFSSDATEATGKNGLSSTAFALRPYQLDGLNWLLYCHSHRQSCILADEMGLGKTIQSVVLLNVLYHKYGLPGPFLIVAPLSTLAHWKREILAWTKLDVLLYHGKAEERSISFDYEFYYRNLETDGSPITTFGLFKFDIVLTTYEMALQGLGHLSVVPWRLCIFDEAHRLKNKASRASEAFLGELYLEHRVLLTGTPLQNSLDELFSLLHFLQPTRFSDSAAFHRAFNNLQTVEDVRRLQSLLKPLMLRRLKDDVEKSIPVKEETIIEVELTLVQKRYYRAILERNFSHLTKSRFTPGLLNVMMELRKCCIHPYLIKTAEETILRDAGLTASSGVDAQMDLMVKSSGKLVLLDKLLAKLKALGHKVLVFSQMTRCLDILQDLLVYRGYQFERIDGAVKGEARQLAIDRFSAETSPEDTSKRANPIAPFVFLLCTRAGGVGINLTAADTVIIYDSDWNPQNDLQAQARCHRIGQLKPVKVYRLLTRGTYEREMFDRAGKKLGLDRAVLQAMVAEPAASQENKYQLGKENADSQDLPRGTIKPFTPMDTSPAPGMPSGGLLTKSDVELLLRKGAYGVLMDNDTEALKFCEEDIDNILERRSVIIRHGSAGDAESQEQAQEVEGNALLDTSEMSSSAPGGTTAPGMGRSSLFSKATFSLGVEQEENVDINDPCFWERWGKQAGLSNAVNSVAGGVGRGRGKKGGKHKGGIDLNNVIDGESLIRSSRLKQSDGHSGSPIFGQSHRRKGKKQRSLANGENPDEEDDGNMDDEDDDHAKNSHRSRHRDHISGDSAFDEDLEDDDDEVIDEVDGDDSDDVVDEDDDDESGSIRYGVPYAGRGRPRGSGRGGGRPKGSKNKPKKIDINGTNTQTAKISSSSPIPPSSSDVALAFGSHDEDSFITSNRGRGRGRGRKSLSGGSSTPGRSSKKGSSSTPYFPRSSFTLWKPSNNHGQLPPLDVFDGKSGSALLVVPLHKLDLPLDEPSEKNDPNITYNIPVDTVDYPAPSTD